MSNVGHFLTLSVQVSYLYCPVPISMNVMIVNKDQLCAQMGASVQSLAHQVAFAAAKRANAVSQNMEDAADTNLDQSSTTTTVTPASAASATTAKPIVLYSKRPSANWVSPLVEHPAGLHAQLHTSVCLVCT